MNALRLLALAGVLVLGPLPVVLAQNASSGLPHLERQGTATRLVMPRTGTRRVGVLAADEGTFVDGTWTPTRRLNGDEVHASTWSGTGVKLPGQEVGVQKITLYRYE